MLKRAEIVERLINEGFKHETLSSFSDYEITMLGTKIITELRQSDIMMQQANLQRRQENCKDANDGCLWHNSPPAPAGNPGVDVCQWRATLLSEFSFYKCESV